MGAFMKTKHAAFAFLLPLLLIWVASAPAAPNNDHHMKIGLNTVGNSGVSGFVMLTQLPHGGTVIHVVAKGLQEGTVYASFYYESNDCTEPADLLGTFTGDKNGEGEFTGKSDDDLDEIGSVSVRLGPGYGT